MSPPSTWPDRLAMLTLGLGLGSVVIGIAAWLSLWMELRWAFYIASSATGLALLACLVWCNWSKFGIPAIGVVPLLLFWLCIGIQPRITDVNMLRAQTLNNAKQNGLAFVSYEDTNEHLPTDIRHEGRPPGLSWRVPLLALATATGNGQEKKPEAKKEPPQIMLVQPPGVVPGSPARLTVRGLRLDAATRVYLKGSTAPVAAWAPAAA